MYAPKMKAKLVTITNKVAKLSDAEVKAIILANVQATIDLMAGKEVTFTSTKGVKSTCKVGMTQLITLKGKTTAEKATLVGVDEAPGLDPKTVKYVKDADGDEHPVHNYTGIWKPAAPNTHFSDGRKFVTYSLFKK